MEENKDGLMEFGSIFGLVDPDKCRDALMKALKDKDYEGLSEVMGVTIDTSRKAVDAINEVLATKLVDTIGIETK